MLIQVAARNSPLSLKQFEEILRELNYHFPNVRFHLNSIATTGDKDKKTSLRILGKTDFFTKEVDEMLLKGECRIAIHSAKDLPDPLPDGLIVVALTKGVSSADALVMRDGETLETLKPNAIIATSSVRREAIVRKLRTDLRFIDLRGTIGERIEKLKTGEADGVVVAEAALIRLQLTHLNRLILPGETVPYQGQLAIMARQSDLEMSELFACLDNRRKTILHVGLEVPHSLFDGKILHCPLIRIVPCPIENQDIQTALSEINTFTHLIFTSKSAVDIFCNHLQGHRLEGKSIIVVGKATARRLSKKGIAVTAVAEEECAEGIAHLLDQMNLQNAYLLWPHSARSRTVLTDHFEKRKLRYRSCILYDTVAQMPPGMPDLNQVDEIHFTSPSTVDAFFDFFGSLPSGKSCKAIGPITEAYLKARLG